MCDILLCTAFLLILLNFKIKAITKQFFNKNIPMSKLIKFLFLIFSAWLLQSCVVTNNLYLNDPEPLGKGSGSVYIGAGTGIKPTIDSISNNSKVNFSNKIGAAPILSIGGQFGIGEHMNIRGAIHFPQIVGGLGLRGGVQYGVFPAKSKFNVAIGLDLGGVWGRDTIKFLEMSTPHEVNQAFNADFCLPISYKFKENFSVILTPRYSFNSFDIKRYTNKTLSTQYNLYAPVLSLGIKIHNFYIESNAIYYNNTLYPHFGVAFIIPKGLAAESKKQY